MAPMVTTDPTARILLAATSLCFVVSEARIRIHSAAHRKGTKLDRGSFAAVVVCLAAGVLTAIWAADNITTLTIPSGWPPVVVGLVMMWFGIALRQWAVSTLGQFFTVVVRVEQGQPVVDHGPYRWVRHPSYKGLVLTLAGLGAALGNWLSLLALLLLPVTGLVIRIHVEERALLTVLGAPYRDYARRHARLFPGIW